MAMTLDDMLGRLLPLLEKKMQFVQDMSQRELSLRERQEQNKTDLEYRKLDDAIKQSKYAQDWDREKTGMVMASNLSIEQAKAANLLDLEKLKGYSAKEVADTNAAAHRYNADATVLSAKWGALGNITKDDKNISEVTDKETGITTKTSTPTAASQKVGQTIQDSLIPPPSAAYYGTPQRSPEGEARNAAIRMAEYRNAGDKAGAEWYAKTLDRDVAKSAIAQVQPSATVSSIVPATTPAEAPVRQMSAIGAPMPSTAPTSMVAPFQVRKDLAPSVIATPEEQALTAAKKRQSGLY